ncbi:HD superfamily NAD metabolism hydrolase [Lacticaseibacillus brantae DSM 23927]|uniref:HD superfamily NAD metabolism hydrolase n=1 Tax=Lacticaseibacillus brantae DSM 23927 TaxID=1423727 RepID=A0A0R2AZV3_9LACO|nr:HD superfamily NAD metabolism hydrolase [Lacticaseibacillus brantae DSM 23927]
MDIDRAGLAGLLHDYAKQISVKDYQNLIQTQGLDPELLNYGRGIWHGLVGVWFIQRELGVSDPEVLQAIVRHTTGDPAMTALDQIIFVADFIEPARDLPGEIAAREAAEHDLLEATLIELTNTLTYLIDNRKVVYPKTLATYNALIKR